MIDKSKVKKMWVWNGNMPNPKTYQRYVIDICMDGCVAIAKNSESSFETNAVYETRWWDHYEEIKECTLNNLPRGWRDAWYRVKGHDIERRIIMINHGEQQVSFISAVEGNGLDVDIENLKNNWQILVDGEWHNCSEYLGG